MAAASIVVLAAGPALAARTRPVAVAPGTAAVDLGTLPGGTGSGAMGLNPAGPGCDRIPDLGTLPGDETSTANAINAGGVIAGFSTAPGGISHAVVRTPSGSGSYSMTNLGSITPDGTSGALALNDAGQVAGD